MAVLTHFIELTYFDRSRKISDSESISSLEDYNIQGRNILELLISLAMLATGAQSIEI